MWSVFAYALATVVALLVLLLYVVSPIVWRRKPKPSYEDKAVVPKKIAVIGAGFSGLVTAKETKELGHEVHVFERSGKIGGCFAHFYQSGTLTGSTPLVCFSSLRDPSVTEAKFYSFPDYCEYLEKFVGKFGLEDNLHFETEVVSVKRVAEEQVEVVIRGKDGMQRTETFHHVAICTGIAQEPTYPKLKGQEVFEGEVLHSSQYQEPSPFKGKRVVVIGLGESGSEISLEIAKVAKQVAIATRNGPGYVVPKFTGSQPADLDGNRVYHGTPRLLAGSAPLRLKRWLEGKIDQTDKNDEEVMKLAGELNAKRGVNALRRFHTKNEAFLRAIVDHGALYKPNVCHLEKNHVVFEDGSTFEADVVLCATGFHMKHEILQQHHQDLAKRACNPRKLFKHCFDTQFKTDIAWIGFTRPGFGGIPPIAELSARYFARLVSGFLNLPSEVEMEKTIVDDKLQYYTLFGSDGEHIHSLVDYLTAMNDFAKLVGCLPPYWKLLLKPRLLFQVLFGPINGLHYRIAGPGAYDVDFVENNLKGTPVAHWTSLVLEVVAYVWGRAVRCCKPHRYGYRVL